MIRQPLAACALSLILGISAGCPEAPASAPEMEPLTQPSSADFRSPTALVGCYDLALGEWKGRFPGSILPRRIHLVDEPKGLLDTSLRTLRAVDPGPWNGHSHWWLRKGYLWLRIGDKHTGGALAVVDIDEQGMFGVAVSTYRLVKHITNPIVLTNKDYLTNLPAYSTYAEVTLERIRCP